MKSQKLTQKELADKLGIRFGQLNKYECGLNAPPMEKLLQLAELLDTTVDYLLTGDGKDERPLHNTRLLERFRALEDKRIPDGFDFAAVSGLRVEAREKFAALTPRSLGQAARIAGISPADITVLWVALQRHRVTSSS